MSVDLESSKTLQRLRQRMSEAEEQSDLRAVLDATHAFKLGWAQLGSTLLEVKGNRSYRDWGSADFKTFCAKELSLRWGTVEKLMRSAYYLKRHEPRWLSSEEAMQPDRPTPELSAVNFLARGEEHHAIGAELRQDLHKEVFELGATGVKVGRLASAALDDAARQALGLKPPSPTDPNARTSLRASRDVEGLMRSLKRVEAPDEVQHRAAALLESVLRWQRSLETSA